MLKTNLCWALWLFAALLSAASTQWEHEATDKEALGFCDWTCMKFVQIWPGSFCVGLSTKFSCKIPSFVKNWTIHGLWPSDIMNCCPCWRLFKSDLQDLPSELSQHWPTLINKTDFYFWMTEWQKHGTCAACIESLSSPSKYFGMALKLLAAYNIDRALEKAQILPSCKQSYQYETLHRALLPVVGEAYEFQCVTDDKNRQILTQVKVSLFRNFSNGCLDKKAAVNPSPYEPCLNTKEVYYFPIRLEKPREPCP